MDPPQIPFKLRPNHGLSQSQYHSQHGLPAPPFGSSLAWNGSWAGSDPFFQGHSRVHHRTFSGRFSGDDQSMPDYSNSATTASSRSVSSMLTRYADRYGAYVEPTRLGLYDDLIEALSPVKDGSSGIFAPANTRASSSDSAQVNPPPSAAAQARTASYSTQRRKVSVPTHAIVRAPSKPHGHKRDSSDISMTSRSSDGPVGQKENVEPKMHKAPANTIKGKKEGSEVVDLDLPSPASRPCSSKLSSRHLRESVAKAIEASMLPIISKRKRDGNLLTQEGSDLESQSMLDVLSSPTRKASKSKDSNAHKTVSFSEKNQSSPLGKIQDVP